MCESVRPDENIKNVSVDHNEYSLKNWVLAQENSKRSGAKGYINKWGLKKKK